MGDYRFVVEGPDMVGKGRFFKRLLGALDADGYSYFDMKRFWLDQGRDPSPADFGDHRIVYLCEPSHYGAGRHVREVHLKEGSPSSLTAEDCSKDRRRVESVLDTLKRAREEEDVPSRLVRLCDRNVFSNIAYQTTQAELDSREEDWVTEDWIMSLFGNQFALRPENLPDYMVVCWAPAETLVERRGLRTEQQDDNIAEKYEFLKRVDRWYRDRAPALCEELRIPYSFVELTGTEEDTDRIADEAYRSRVRPTLEELL